MNERSGAETRGRIAEQLRHPYVTKTAQAAEAAKTQRGPALSRSI